jgi:1,2-diacylglycerol 3-beta-galactosyltransferase
VTAPVQFIFICGKNQKLAERLRQLPTSFPKYVEGFTAEVPYYMHLSDFFIGKPGPGSISEALAMQLPVVLERNAWTLPQERYNAEWVTEKRVGVVLKSFREVVHGVRQVLEPAALAELRKNIAAQKNRAIFEIPEILAKLLGEVPAETAQQVSRSTVHAGV